MYCFRRHRSFLFGVLVTSIIWLIFNYCYPQINQQQFLHKKFGSTKLYMHNDTTINELGMIRNLEDKVKRDFGYKNYAFNILVSDNIGDYREVPDTRNSMCPNMKKFIPTVSIVMCFFNEHHMTLIRSINSILKRTNESQFKELILVDDSSDIINSNLISEISRIDTLRKVKVLRNSKREGLIRSRVYGARQATGDILIFFDSHIEVNINWLQPLIAPILEDETTVTVPIIDLINPDTFYYSSSPLVRGGFNWGLHFKWDNVPKGTFSSKADYIKPYKSPTMPGGLFAIDRKYFIKLGEYDLGMSIWGGENIELSFRIWQCGGKILIVPCSRVGHIFRKRRPYGSLDGTDTMVINSLRAAFVWMDSYRDYFINATGLQKLPNFGDISDRLLIRNKLKCKTFDWYLSNVYPELDIPGQQTKENDIKPVFVPWNMRKRNYLRKFYIKLHNTNLCVTSFNKNGAHVIKKKSTLQLQKCLSNKNQQWSETDKSELVLGSLLCLQSSSSKTENLPILNKCHESGGDQEWKLTGTTNAKIYNMAAGACLSVDESRSNVSLVLSFCSNPLIKNWDLVVAD